MGKGSDLLCRERSLPFLFRKKMGYEIIYDRKFIKIGEDKYIPLFQYGSNNCYQYSPTGRIIPEKRWCIFNYSKERQYIFSKEEIEELAKAYSNAEFFKTRYTPFKEGEFEKWYKNGIKSAKPLSLYLKLGNTFVVRDMSNLEKYYPASEEELLELIEALKDKPLDMGFEERNLKLPKKVRKRKKPVKVFHWYALHEPKKGIYLVRLLRYGYRYSWSCSDAKPFMTKKQAEQYLEKNSYRLPGFTVLEVNSERMI